MHPPQRSAAEWFAVAQRAYIEDHQGCAWCGGQHRVHRVREGGRTTFLCQHCDFQVFFDAHASRCEFIPGEEVNDVTETMLGYPIFQ
jgi:hypothetical protein